MINFIVGSALVMTAVCLVTWLIFPTVRERIEQPKYVFQQRLQDHDSLAASESPMNAGEQSR